MYEQHFGLNKRPFRASATGDDVFVGPNIAATMAGIKKALSANDAIITVSGAVGSGKTTLATHALESISGGRIVVHVGRIRLNSEDVLELLLDELGFEDKPRGTIQRFAVLRRKLKELEDKQTRVFVIIEDSVRLGADALAEIEALTSADAGESEGASVILMGDDNLKTLLAESQLVRVQQRVRQRFTVAALCATDLHEYLRHCFRLNGGDFDKIFEANAAQLLHYLSGGIPRINNNLVESAMAAAADQDLNQVGSALLSQVADNEYGLSTDDFDLTPPIEPPVPQEPEPSPLPEPPVAAETENSSTEDDVPELIQDTLPDLKILAPEFAAGPVPAVTAVEPPLEIESSGVEVPAWERDPTMAELKPDLDALEQAMAVAQGANPEAVAENNEPLPEPEPEVPEVIPEITLDNAINERIESEQTDKTSESNPPVSEETPAAAAEEEQNNQSDEELQKMAVELSKAKSIEDIDDKLAETLFGEELNLIAAKFAVNPPPPEPLNEPVNKPANKVPAVAPHAAQAPITASQRLRTVRALNVDSKPATPQPATPQPATPQPVAAPRNHLPITDPTNAPDSFEDQINTSISDTQTQRVLNVIPPEDADADEDEAKGGFFSRFKRS